MSDTEPTSLGEFLRSEREKRNITIEQVASATRVGVRILHGLESDNYSEMPAKPFIRGFVTAYARFIGLDPQEILTRYQHFIDEKSKERPLRDAGHSGYAFERPEGDQSRTVLWIVMAAFLLIGGVLLLILKPALKRHRHAAVDRLKTAEVSPSPTPSGSGMPLGAIVTATPSPSPTATADVTEVVRVATPTPVPRPTPKAKPVVASASPRPVATGEAPSKAPAAAPSPAPTGSSADPLNSGVGLKGSEIKHKVIVKALADIWVRYVCDNRPSMKFILRKDRVLVLRAVEHLILQTSPGSQASVKINGADYPTLEAAPGVVDRKGVKTLMIPRQLAETTQEPFAGERELPHDVPGSSHAAP